jgi:hypothetical protein
VAIEAAEARAAGARPPPFAAARPLFASAGRRATTDSDGVETARVLCAYAKAAAHACDLAAKTNCAGGPTRSFRSRAAGVFGQNWGSAKPSELPSAADKI